MTPEKIPAPPRPAIARPTMKTMELGAAPHITEPISKTATHAKNTLAAVLAESSQVESAEGGITV